MSLGDTITFAGGSYEIRGGTSRPIRFGLRQKWNSSTEHRTPEMKEKTETVRSMSGACQERRLQLWVEILT